MLFRFRGYSSDPCCLDDQWILLHRLGYHVLCQHAGLSQIPSELINHLYSTAHQQIMVDLSWNSLSVLPCDFLQLTSMISLIVTNNRLESIPTCFSQSAIQTFVVKNNTLRFNQTHLLSSRKLLHLDLSENRLPSLPSTFLIHLRRLRTLVLTGQSHLLESNHDHWIRSIPTRNQLSLVLCDEHLSLSLCLFPDLFQEKKLFALELHSHVNCDCSLVYLPAEKLQFRQCSPKHVPLGQCDQHVSRFDQGQSIGQFRKQNYRRICAPEYERCQQLAWNKQYLANTTRFLSTDASRAFSPSQVQLVSLIGNSSVIEPRTTMGTSIAFTVTSKKDNMSAGAIISLSLLLLLVTVVCLYVILSRHYFKMKHHQKFTDYMIKRRKKRPSSNETTQGIQNLAEEKNFSLSSQSKSLRTKHQHQFEPSVVFLSTGWTTPFSFRWRVWLDFLHCL